MAKAFADLRRRSLFTTLLTSGDQNIGQNQPLCTQEKFGSQTGRVSSNWEFALRFRVPGIELKNPSSPEIRKKYEKIYEIPHPFRASKIRKKIQKKYKNGPKITVFVFFLYFFRIFGARPGVGDFIIFSYFFRISRLEGFLSSMQERGVAKFAAHSPFLGNRFETPTPT